MRTEPRFASFADLALCREMIRVGSRTFHVSSKFLPTRVRDAALSLYAFCRVADDAVDHALDIDQAVADLMRRLDHIYAHDPLDHAADRAFADIVIRFAIPRALPDALIEGFAWDAAGRRYDSLSSLVDYAVRVAGTVGAMMAILMQARSTQAIARAADLGIAMQLTNIARDVGDDARLGRIYLPRFWMSEAGLDPDAFLRQPQFSQALGQVVARLLMEADQYYARASSGIPLLPSNCRRAILASRLLYAEIGQEVAKNNYDSVSVRAFVSRSRKLALLGCAAFGLIPKDSSEQILQSAPCVPEAQFLVSAVEQAGEPILPPKSFDDQLAFVSNLFIRLQQSQAKGDVS